MTLHSLLTSIQDLPLSAAIRGDMPEAEWLFPILETLHVLALAVTFGSIAILDMRLIGWRWIDRPVSSLARGTVPVTWSAWVVAAITGSLLFMSKAVAYAGNTEFRLKFVVMGLAAANMLVFHFGEFRRVDRWDTAQVPPGPARLAGALSIALWVAVIFLGRWIGFTT